MAWQDVFNSIIGSNSFHKVPALVANMARDYNCYDCIRLGKLPYPVLYDIVPEAMMNLAQVNLSIDWLWQYEIKGIIIADSSTALMRTLIAFLKNSSYTVSISPIEKMVKTTYSEEVFVGLVLKFRKKK